MPNVYSGGTVILAAAAIPALFLLWKVYQMDRTEKEPTSLIVSLMFLGVISTFLAMITEQFGIGILNNFLDQDSVLYRFLLFFGVVAVSEEGFKYLFLKKRTWNIPEFDTAYDGIIYAVSVSLGFALFENILYVMSYGLEVAAIRAVTAIPGHACFSVFMGLWYAQAKKCANAMDAKGYQYAKRMTLLVPILLHGAYDFFASMDYSGSTIIFFLFIFLFYRRAYRMVKNISVNDTRL